MIIGVAGPNAAGKGEVIRYLADRAYGVLSLSDVLRDALRSEGHAETREKMIEIGRRFRAKQGPGALAMGILEKVEPNRNYAIDSIRHPGEVEVLAQSGRPFTLCWVDADPRVRFERLLERARPGDPTRFEDFLELESRELESPASGGQQLLAVKELATHTLQNDGSVEALEAQLDRFLAGLP